MHFTDSSKREKHAFIDASLANTADLLSRPEVQEHLGSTAVENALYLINNSFVPNVRHGRAKAPWRTTGTIPIIALKPAEEIIIDKDLMTSTESQLAIAAQKASAWHDRSAAIAAADIRLQMRPQIRDRGLQFDPMHTAFVFHHGHKYRVPAGVSTTNPNRTMLTRPVACLQIGATDQTRVCPSTVVHELVHAEQVLLDPLKRYDNFQDIENDHYRGELEAYHREAVFVDALAHIGYNSTEEAPGFTIDSDGHAHSFAALIDNLRHETNAGRKDSFFPNGTLKKRLGEKGLNIIGI